MPSTVIDPASLSRLIVPFDILAALGVGRLAAMITGFAVTFVVRGLAIRYGWSWPVFRASARQERWTTTSGDKPPE